MENKKESTFGMKFSRINVSRYSQYDISNFDESAKPLVEYQTNFQLRIIKESNEVGILATVKLILIESKELFAELKVECFFEIKPFDSIIKQKDENNFEISNEIITNLTSVVIGTIRGILYEKLKGTPLQNEVFPLISSKDLSSI